MMTRVAKDLAKQRKTSRQVKGAMTYPAIMLAVAVLAVAVWHACTAGSDQMAVQRYLATRDARAARDATWHGTAA